MNDAVKIYQMDNDRFEDYSSRTHYMHITTHPLVVGEDVVFATNVRGKKYTKAIAAYVVMSGMCNKETFEMVETLGQLFQLPVTSWDDVTKKLNVNDDTTLYYSLTNKLKWKGVK